MDSRYIQYLCGSLPYSVVERRRWNVGFRSDGQTTGSTEYPHCDSGEVEPQRGADISGDESSSNHDRKPSQGVIGLRIIPILQHE